MATYECSKCGMSVNATCAKCNAHLVNDTLKLDDGSKVQISKCPNNHGKIKSPVCLLWTRYDLFGKLTGTRQQNRTFLIINPQHRQIFLFY